MKNIIVILFVFVASASIAQKNIYGDQNVFGKSFAKDTLIVEKAIKFSDGSIQATAPNGATDHGALTGLSDDDHTQYPLLSGRSGGQIINGGTLSGNNLTLKSTSNATKGKILFGTSAYDEVNNRLGIGTVSPRTKLEVKKLSALSTITIVSNNFSKSSLNFRSDDGTLGNDDFSSYRIQSGWNGSETTFIDAVLEFDRPTSEGVFSNVMTLKGGNVGIGTTTPSAKLAINGGLHVGGDSDPGDNNLTVDGNITLPSGDINLTGRLLITKFGGGSSAGIQIQSTSTTSFVFEESDAPTDQKFWDILADQTSISFRAVNDANTDATSFFTATRGTGIAITNVTISPPLILSSALTLANTTTTVDGNVTFDRTNEDLSIGDGTASQIVHIGAWKTWTPVFTGFSTDPTVTDARYTVVGKMVTVRLQTGNGTSNATTFTITLPIAAQSSGKQYCTIAQVTDNGSFKTTPGLLRTNANSTTADIFINSDQGGTAWQNTGGKKANFVITYESN